MSKLWKWVILLSIIAISFYFGTLISSKSSDGAQVAIKADIKPLFYRNPMNPEVTSPTPSKDNMGMDYIPVYADNEDKGNALAGTVRIDPVVVQNIGVRTAKAKTKSFGRTIRTVGRVEFDEERMVNLHPKVEGWIDKMYVDKTGEQVKEDTILLNIYSPILVTAQQEYLLALNNLRNLQGSTFNDVRRGAEQLVESSKERLKLLDVPDHQIRELEETRKIKKNIHIHSPSPGTVVKIGAREGQYVTPQTELYMIVDLSQVWVYANVYEYEVPWVNVGDEVDMTLASVPGKTLKGKVVYIYPYAQENTRTTKVRIVFENKEHMLRPNMFADVGIRVQSKQNMIVIPSEAVVRSGKKEQVFVVRGPGKYEPRAVILGIESNGEVAVLSGLDAGEEIVTSAQFLVDSESKLREAASKMVESKKSASQSHSNMSPESMDGENQNRMSEEHSHD